MTNSVGQQNSNNTGTAGIGAPQSTNNGHHSQGGANVKAKKSKSNTHRQGQRQQKKQVISQFDMLEEARYKSYETQQTLEQLIGMLERQEVKGSGGGIVKVTSETWSELQQLAKQSFQFYSDSNNHWNTLFDNLSQQISSLRSMSASLRTRLQQLRQHQQVQRRGHEDTLKDIAKAYNKNRTQLFTVMDEMEVAVREIKEGVEKGQGFKHLMKGYLTGQMEKDMEDALTDVVLTLSGGNTGSHVINTVNSTSSRNLQDYNDLYHPHQRQQISQPPQLQLNTLQLQQQNPDVMTPRTQQQMSQRRGRSQQPQQKEQKMDVLPPQHPGSLQADGGKRGFNIPLLPIHKINNESSAQNSHRGAVAPSQNSQRNHSQRQLSSRRGQLPPTHNNLNSNRQGNVSQRSRGGVYEQGSRSNRQISSRQGDLDSKRSIQGGIIDGEYLVNPVFLGAVYQTSHFDKGLEDDYEGADQTLCFDTDRLKQYPDEYQQLMELDDEDKRILLKQVLFIMHEKELKAQAKQEKALRAQQRRAMRLQQQQQQQQQNQGQFDGTTPRARLNQINSSNDENQQTLKEPSLDMINRESANKNHPDISLLGSHISLQRQLPLLGTLEIISARRKERLNDVKLDQLLDVTSEIECLIKTATEKSIIMKIEQEFQRKEELLREDRRVLEWSSQDNGIDQSVDQSRLSEVRVDTLFKQQRKSIDDSQIGNVPFLIQLDPQPQVAGNNNMMQMAKGQDSNVKLEQNKGKKIVTSSQNNQALMSNIENLSSNRGQSETPMRMKPNSNYHLQTSPSQTLDHQSLLNQNFPVVELNRNPSFPLIGQNLENQPEKAYTQQSYDNQPDFVQASQLGIYYNPQGSNDQQLEIIHERQSELSSSINTNNKQTQQSRAGLGYKKSLGNGVMMIGQQQIQMGRRNSEQQQMSVLSARESQTAYQQNSVIDFNRLQFLQGGGAGPKLPSNPVEELKVFGQVEQDGLGPMKEENQKELKRCKSHRQSLQSAPNSQRDQKNKKLKHVPSDLGNVELNNYQSIQIENSFEDINEKNQRESVLKRKLKNSNHKKNKRPVTDLGQHGVIDTFSSGASLLDSIARNKLESEVHQSKMFVRRHSPMLMDQQIVCPQHFSSIQNQFGDSKTSGFQNESLFLEEGSVRFNKSPKAISDRDFDYRENDDICDFDDIDLNQIHQIYNKFMPVSAYLRDTSNQNPSSSQKPEELKQRQQQSPLQQNRIIPNNNSLSLRHHFFLNNILNQNNITSSLLLQGNQSNPSAGGLIFPGNTQKHNQSNLLQSRGLTANMITNYLLKNFTQFKGQMTRDLPTSKKTGDQKGTLNKNGQSGFTLSTLGDETLMFMFPAQKTQRRTLFMLQNFNNNYYNNCAGVLFTMPISSGEINNGFLQQCSTVPSADPELCSGVLQKQLKHLKNPHQPQITGVTHGASGTQDSTSSFINRGEDSGNFLTYNGQRLNPHFYNDPHQVISNTMYNKNLTNSVIMQQVPGEGNGTSKSSFVKQMLQPNTGNISELKSGNLGLNCGQQDLSQSPKQNNYDISPNNNNTNKSAIQVRPVSGQPVFKRSHIQIKKDSNPISSTSPVIHPSQAKNGSVGVFNRNIKILYNPTHGGSGTNMNSGLAKLQAIAGNALSANGGGNLILKRPNQPVIRVQRASTNQSNINSSNSLLVDTSTISNR